MGTLNFIDAAAVRRAAGAVRGGRVFSLNAPVDEPAPPLFGREELRHEMIEKAGGTIVDDYLDRFHPQGASQWDALKHYADAEAGFYGGHDLAAAMATGASPIGIEHWARAGIAARGVLLDARRALDFDPLAGYAIDAAALASLAERQGVELLPGDALVVRTGWLEAYLELGEEERAAIAAAGDPPCPGLAGEDLAPFLWDNRIAAVATDNPALEAAYEGAAMGLELHRDLIARLGMPVGELWVVDDLAADCAADGTYEFLLTSAPINLPGGAGSPANALAIR
jgi:kynurenine formamidase